MNLLIFGGNGWIGKQFIEILKNNNINYTKANCRADENLTNEIDKINPTHVVSFIGRTSGKINNKVFTTIDYLEQENKLQENIRDNLYGPLNLALICENKNIHFTYLGTGCIFNYDDNHQDTNNGFKETDNPNFFGSSYSIVKGFTDRIMKNFSKVLNLRIRMPITDKDETKNFITKITTYEKICSIPNSMTVLPELLPLMLKLIKNNTVGTINFTNPGVISHNEILEMYKEIVDPEFTWKNFSIEDQNKILASKRSNNFLNTDKLLSKYNVDNIKDAVKKCLVKYKLDLQNKFDSTTILVTGGCGFIGSNFLNYIFKKYRHIKIINIDCLNYCGNINNIDQSILNSQRYIFYPNKIQDNKLLLNILKEHNVKIVIHFAAQSHVDNSFTNSLRYTDDNILGTHHLLEASRVYNNLDKFIYVSTDEVYGESMLNDSKTKNEKNVLCPTNPYSATKAGAEMLVCSYYHSFNLPIIVTRGNNVYGYNQYPEKLIPKFVNLLKDNKKLTIHGDGKNIRSFLFIEDVVSAFDIIMCKGKIGEIYNIGGDDESEISVLDISKKLIELVKKKKNYSNYLEYIEDRPFNDKRYFISNNKIKSLGWKIKINIDDGLKKYLQKNFNI